MKIVKILSVSVVLVGAALFSAVGATPPKRDKSSASCKREITREEDLQNYERYLRGISLDALSEIVKAVVNSSCGKDAAKVKLAQEVLIDRESSVDFLKNEIWPLLSVEALEQLLVYLLQSRTVWNRTEEAKKINALSRVIGAKKNQNNTASARTTSASSVASNELIAQKRSLPLQQHSYAPSVFVPSAKTKPGWFNKTRVSIAIGVCLVTSYLWYRWS